MLNKSIVRSVNYCKFISLYGGTKFDFCQASKKEKHDELKKKHVGKFRSKFMPTSDQADYPKNLSDYKRTLNELSSKELGVQSIIANEDPKEHIKRAFNAVHNDEIKCYCGRKSQSVF